MVSHNFRQAPVNDSIGQPNYDIYGRPLYSITYASVDDLRSRVRNMQSDYPEILEEQLRAASRVIESYCRRVFYPYENTYYLNSGVRRIVLPDELLSLFPPPEPWPLKDASAEGQDEAYRKVNSNDADNIAGPDDDYEDYDEDKRTHNFPEEVLDEDPDFVKRAQRFWDTNYHPSKLTTQAKRLPPSSFYDDYYLPNLNQLKRDLQKIHVPFGLTTESDSNRPNIHFHPTYPPYRIMQLDEYRYRFRMGVNLYGKIRYEYAARGVYGGWYSPIPPAPVKWATLYLAVNMQLNNDTREPGQVDTTPWNEVLYNYLATYRRPLTARSPLAY